MRSIDLLTAEHIEMIQGLFEGLGSTKSHRASAHRLADIMVGNKAVGAVEEAKRNMTRIENLVGELNARMDEITKQYDASKCASERTKAALDAHQIDVGQVKSQMQHVLRQMDEVRELVGIAEDDIHGAF